MNSKATFVQGLNICKSFIIPHLNSFRQEGQALFFYFKNRKESLQRLWEMSKVTQEVNFEAVYKCLFLFPLSPFPCQVVFQLQSNHDLCSLFLLFLEIYIYFVVLIGITVILFPPLVVMHKEK